MKKILGIISICLLTGTAQAAQRYLPGIDLIPREERGAQERRGHYTPKPNGELSDYQKRLQEGGDNPTFEARKQREELNAKRNAYMAQNYPQDIGTDNTVYKEGSNNLIRPRAYVRNKRKIVIHHTADALEYNDGEDVERAINHFHELHATKHGRGDIGYNFLIDPFGNIYEGRAGGQGVVGAHADRNNSSTLGISLMGNFDVTEPTGASLRSLIKLSVSLGYYYGIWPMTKMPYFTALQKEPYISVATHDAVVGHKDTKLTACPGEYLYNKIPTIKQEVNARMNWLAQSGVRQLMNEMYTTIQKPFILDGESGIIWIDALNEDENVSCTGFVQGPVLGSCQLVGNKLLIEVFYQGGGSSGIKTIGVKQGNDVQFVEFGAIRKNELDQKKEDLKNSRKQSSNRTQPSSKKKSNGPIRIQQAKDAFERQISVLLYELTAEYDSWEFVCEGICLAIVNGERFPNPGQVSVIRKEDESLTAYINQQAYPVESSFGITSSGLIEVQNYTRETGGHPLNIFKGSLTLTTSKRTHLDQGEKEGRVMINTLPFRDYLLGIGEGSEYQHPEKLKTLVLLAKQYALRYTAGENKHPSVPEGVGYTAIDDPRFFQRYVGAGREAYARNRVETVQQVQENIISYNKQLPILPYFHCSGGFTLSGSEKRGRTDTPWLQGNLDVTSCESGGFEGHGVGLSGDGAEKMAQAGVGMEDILKWFYEGIEVE